MPEEPSRSRVAGGLQLTLTCVWCGRPIVLVASPYGVSVPDRRSFLDGHGRCLRVSDRQKYSPDMG
jgi:hypothetical protein